MITADLVAIILVATFCLLGLWLGFGRGLAFFTKGIFGIFISVIVCYCLGGFILNVDFVNELVTSLNAKMSEGGGFLQFLASVHFEIVVYYIVLFIITLVVRIIIVRIIRSIAEINNVFIKILNKTFGMVFFVCVLILFTLLVFQIIYAIGGTTSDNFAASLSGSFFKLDKLYSENPILALIKIFRDEIIVPVT